MDVLFIFCHGGKSRGTGKEEGATGSCETEGRSTAHKRRVDAYFEKGKGEK